MKLLNGAVNSINAAALLIGAAGLLSRILGVLRDRLLAGVFGASRELDIYYAAFQIPDFMAVIFLLGGASAAVLPIFQEYLTKDKKEAQNLISDLATFFLWSSFFLSVAAFFMAPLAVKLIAPGFSQEAQTLTAKLTRFMLISPVLFGLSGILSSVLQSFQRFWAFALAPVLYNLGIIAGILFLFPLFGMYGLVFGVILGALLHFLIHLWVVKNLGFSPRIIWRGLTGGIRRVIGLSFPRVLSVSLSRLTMLVLVAIASTLAEGSITIFQLAQNLYFVPIGIFGVSYSIALFPRLSRSFIARDGGDFFRDLFWGMRSILFWIMPSIALFVVLRAHIVRAALGAGVFSWEDTRLTAAVLAVLSVGMFAEALGSLIIKGFYALENTRMPLVINIGASFFSVFLAVVLSNALAAPSFLREAVTGLLRISDLADPRVSGLAFGFSLGLIANIGFLYWALKRLAGRIFKQESRFPLKELLKIVISAVLAGFAAYLVRVSFSETLPLITFMRVLGQGAGAGVVGLAVYFGALYLMRGEDVYSLIAIIRRRLFGVKTLPPSWDGEVHVR